MGKRIFSLLLWGLAALVLMQTCFPDDNKQTTDSAGRAWVESFAVAAPETYPLVLENDLIYSEWSAIGASCGKIYLKQYNSELNTPNATEHGMLIYNSLWVDAKQPKASEEGTSFHYRRHDAFRLIESDDFLSLTNPSDKSKANLDSATWKVEQSPNGLRFTILNDNNLEIVKEISLGDGYHFDAVISAVPHAKELLGRDLQLELGTGGGIYIEDDDFYPNPYIGVALTEYGKLESVDFETPDGDKPETRDVTRRWADSNIPFVVEGSKYFISAIRPQNGKGFQGAKYETLFDDYAMSEDLSADSAKNVTVSIESPYWLRASVNGVFPLHFSTLDSAVSRSFQWYIGPKSSQQLTESKYGEMSEMIDHADYERSFFYRIFFTSSIAPAILWLLQFFYSIVGNYGIAIILLTILVKAAVFPIMRTSQIKMATYQAKMAVVKPQLDAINKKYANDPQKKNQATMEIYKKHRLSPPIGGCLPMFLQMPIFIGLFQALRSSILLRHEPFFGWIKDLSQPDAFLDFGGPLADFPLLSSMTTLNILPIIMVVLWVYHQRSMPKPADPQQAQMQKMMTMMPIIFGFVLYNYAAGLSLYMIMSSVIGIFEQRVIRKRWPVPTADDINKAK